MCPSSASPMNPRTKSQKPPPMGITAGVEDSKYQAKYKELKRKVKDIESDNEKLHFKVLNAKRNIQRMKLERAILYERLGQVSPSPAPIDRHSAPAHHPGPPVHHSPVNHPPSMDPDPISSNIPGPIPESRRQVSPRHRHLSCAPRHLIHAPPQLRQRRPRHPPTAPPPPNPPIPLDGPRSPHSHPHHDRSRNLPPQQDPYHIQGPQHYVDNLPPMQHVLHSPQMAERDREAHGPADTTCTSSQAHTTPTHTPSRRFHPLTRTRVLEEEGEEGGCTIISGWAQATSTATIPARASWNGSRSATFVTANANAR
ncbi:hypothetical protein BDP27DRAFT_712942 [Rhodocollybia butyracea]|uniref:INO80 complex subunit F domain-containing protein n=1 Tax=Rhodocollybia butyracea TaxID=206335 RepID=A0A9P5UG43_9AGAR|nr:hypothetical protein BDP27DRAFT_712942 [Rhodocollybia butyracea]